ncbi:Phosphatase 2C like protein [Termitomyces sp. T112]|nr:Phosphatase 2C like protein [Termitomyces sp. T112]
MSEPLFSPKRDKNSKSGGDARLFFGLSEMQGWRPSMEDTHVVMLHLDEGKEVSNTFFAVYDGHCGSYVAKYAEENVHKCLVEEESYKQGQYELAMERAFLRADEDLSILAKSDKSDHSCQYTGCTAIAALVTTDGKIYVANAGDSRSVISVRGRAEPLSHDHKPSHSTERTRIYAAGGYVYDDRVNGRLSLSRAFGDFWYKQNSDLGPEKQIITANPDVIIHEISEEDEFFVIACDGIWDCLSSQVVIDFIRNEVSRGKELAQICEDVCDRCIAPLSTRGEGPRGGDNMTIMIVAILHGRTKEGWYEWVKGGAKTNYEYPVPYF